MCKVSVIIPAFNCAAFLQECLASLLSQTHHHLELLLINDASTDETVPMLEQFCRDDARITLLHNAQRVGAAASRNIGLDHASGDYILFVDADDWLPHHAIASLLQGFAGDDAQWVIGGHRQIKASSNDMLFGYTSVSRLDTADISRYVEHYLEKPYQRVMLVHCWGRLYQRSLIEQYRIRFHAALRQFEDVHFNFQYLQHINALRFIPQALYYHRIHQNPNSLSRQMGLESGFIASTQLAMLPLRDYLLNKRRLSAQAADAVLGNTMTNMLMVSIIRLCRLFISTGMASRLAHSPSRHSIYKQIQCICQSDIFRRHLPLFKPRPGEALLLYWACRSGWAPAVLLTGILRSVCTQLPWQKKRAE